MKGDTKKKCGTFRRRNRQSDRRHRQTLVANVKDFLSSFLQKTPSLPSSDSSMSEFKGGNVPKLIEAKKKLLHSTYELLNPKRSDDIPRDYKDPLQFAKANENFQERATIGRDIWSQLKRVSIPVFNGEKKTYEGWNTAFMACIDQKRHQRHLNISCCSFDNIYLAKLLR